MKRSSPNQAAFTAFQDYKMDYAHIHKWELQHVTCGAPAAAQIDYWTMVGLLVCLLGELPANGALAFTPRVVCFASPLPFELHAL